MLILATISAVIASQAIITATFSIVKQSVALGCFPRVKIVHTSHQFQGQVYIPEINWILMTLCLVITAGFRDTYQIGNAYGELLVPSEEHLVNKVGERSNPKEPLICLTRMVGNRGLLKQHMPNATIA